MEYPHFDFKDIISVCSFALAFCSLYFSRKSWFDTYRPIVTVRVTTHESGNMATTLNLVVENFGNRPAKNIKLSVDSDELKSALLIQDGIDRKAIERCFADETIIPVLANGQSISNSFGCLGIQYDTSSVSGRFGKNERSDWKVNSRFNVCIKYKDLNSKSYQEEMPILIASDRGFAGSVWEKPTTSSNRL